MKVWFSTTSSALLLAGALLSQTAKADSTPLVIVKAPPVAAQAVAQALGTKPRKLELQLADASIKDLRVTTRLFFNGAPVGTARRLPVALTAAASPAAAVLASLDLPSPAFGEDGAYVERIEVEAPNPDGSFAVIALHTLFYEVRNQRVTPLGRRDYARRTTKVVPAFSRDGRATSYGEATSLPSAQSSAPGQAERLD